MRGPDRGVHLLGRGLHRDLFTLLPGTGVDTPDWCCCHAGPSTCSTWNSFDILNAVSTDECAGDYIFSFSSNEGVKGDVGWRDGGGAQVKSAVRTVELLEYFAGRPGMHSLASVQEAVGYPKSSLYMLLRTLVELGWVETDATGTRYGIGVRALLVGTSYIDGDEVVAAARPTLDRLSDDTTETIHLARLDGTNVVYLATRQSQHYLRPFTRVGRRLPRTRRRWARRC